MADNVTITAGSGTIVATDERSIASTSVHVQRVVPLGGSSIANAHVTVTNSATTIKAATETQHCVIIVNYQTVPIYVGGATVTTSTGFRLDPGASLSLHTTAEVQGIT
ncbi:MAG: hypothetical protein ACM3MJ_00280, partial [Deltaproteobacteria bacterium]